FYFLYKKHNFDIVHISNLVNMPDFFLKLIGSNIPSVTTVHTTLKSQSHIQGTTNLRTINKEPIERLTSLFYPVLQCCESVYLKKSVNLITVSEWVKNFISSKHLKNVRVIYNGVDPEKFSPHNNHSAEFSFLEKIRKPIVLYIGRLLTLKGIDILIKSIKQVVTKYNVYFLLAGTGNINRWKKQLYGVSKENYGFLGYVDYEKINYLYTKADLFVLPSFTESFPLVILEAMASGVPVIATNVGGIPEIIEDKKDGILIAPNDPAVLSDSIIMLINKHGLRKKISKNAREKVMKHFTARIMAEKTNEFYEEILKG
ncbi:MAG: glycosyltransferase family 4 protein, partial [Promethearchaeota archaeon]